MKTFLKRKERIDYFLNKIEMIAIIPLLIIAIPLDMMHQKYNLKMTPNLAKEVTHTIKTWRHWYFNHEET